LRLLARRDRSVAELSARLEQAGHRPEIVGEVVSRLKALGWLDDAAYARRFAEAAVRLRRWGGRRIERELVSRGVPQEDARVASRGAVGEGGEEALAREIVMERTAGRGTPEDPAARRRLAGWLARRGFGAGAVAAALRECGRRRS
jgi:regulatory protein